MHGLCHPLRLNTNPMKISFANYSTLNDAIAQAQSESNIRLEEYIAQGLTAKRWRWDLLWYSTAKILPQHWVCDELYKADDLNDAHIDSALKKITNTK